ncbi:hypothetical protein CHLRE_17g747047v5 [Chlamydomonas reinhardtii]|uniref:Uncharacterized protein n=1 Tax=Chlamydomonas reinhardtii TaxID=3055 RepID=A0A2K3CS75_CHLRE|nr:uncharacterized protein CHLRE_17g747047v5 [Chlamydomonas reinhardtii]PNW71111.1 hypothetical protein CHLRE_17g747047v5 [Chlamydomonas reinhardtii]
MPATGRDSRHEHMQGQGMFVLLGASFEESAYEFGGCEYRLCVSASPAAAAAPGASVAAAGGCGGLTVRLEFSLPRLPAGPSSARCCACRQWQRRGDAAGGPSHPVRAGK